MEELITLQQVADYLKVDRFTGQWRFKQAMIDSWLMRHSNMSEEEAPMTVSVGGKSLPRA